MLVVAYTSCLALGTSRHLQALVTWSSFRRPTKAVLSRMVRPNPAPSASGSMTDVFTACESPSLRSGRAPQWRRLRHRRPFLGARFQVHPLVADEVSDADENGADAPAEGGAQERGEDEVVDGSALAERRHAEQERASVNFYERIGR